MADIKLGPLGFEVSLPPITWSGHSAPDLRVDAPPATNSQTMLDGSVHTSFREHSPQAWPLEWARLTLAQLQTLLGLRAKKEILRFQPNFVDATWYWVKIADFDWSVQIQTVPSGTTLYRAAMLLEEQD